MLLASDTYAPSPHRGAQQRAETPQAVAINPALALLARSRCVMLLQGPVGPFFDRLAGWLHRRGTQVHRVVFQGGDAFDCRAVDPIRFDGRVHDWPEFLGRELDRVQPECIVLFGQSRRYHQAAMELARQRGVHVVVTEEGYFRPGFVTMELDGVNGYSMTLSRYVWKPLAPVPSSGPEAMVAGALQPDISPWHFQKMAWHASQHYSALDRERRHFPYYQHHRRDDPYFYARYWVRSWLRKLAHSSGDQRFQEKLLRRERPYFLVPLQFDGDSQLTCHSPFNGNAAFVIRVMQSFAAHAPADALLVFRQHPHTRGGTGHQKLIATLADELCIDKRVHHLVEGDTPLLAQHSDGVVVVNSTVGLQALERGAPLIAMGDALYKQRDLTFEGELDDFWAAAKPASPAVAQRFLSQVKNLTQAPASVYALREEPLQWGMAESPAP
jgi:capsular polysaccharide export protein